MKTILTPDQEALARQVAQDIGRRFKTARRVAGERQIDVAQRLRMHSSTVSAFERGRWANLKLGNAVRILSAYQISLIAVTLRRTTAPLENAS
jgi:transcriptional regulator with XRE-family HTH domain